jgi:hypothetical protein
MPQKVKQEKINQIKELKKSGYTHNEICKITKSSKRTVTKICAENVYIKYPEIKIPKSIKETQYPGYYIGVDGKAYREPGKRDRNAKLNEYGLIPLNTHLRGNTSHTKYQYPSINITLRDENGNFLRQKKVNIHRLVAETFIPNPNNYLEVDHVDRNKHNNSTSNLRWVSRVENMAWNAKSFKITCTKSGEVYIGINLMQWIKENWKWISQRTKMKKEKDFWCKLRYRKKHCGFLYEEFES